MLHITLSILALATLIGVVYRVVSMDSDYEVKVLDVTEAVKPKKVKVKKSKKTKAVVASHIDLDGTIKDVEDVEEEAILHETEFEDFEAYKPKFNRKDWYVEDDANRESYDLWDQEYDETIIAYKLRDKITTGHNEDFDVDSLERSRDYVNYINVSGISTTDIGMFGTDFLSGDDYDALVEANDTLDLFGDSSDDFGGIADSGYGTSGFGAGGEMGLDW
jgi:hypothetical protein